MRPEEAPTDQLGQPHLRLSTSVGSITITAEGRDDVEVTSNGKVKRYPTSEPDAISVGHSSAVEVRCPTGTNLVVGSRAGSVRLIGRFGDVRITTSVSSIFVANVGSADLRTVSGSVEVAHCAGLCRVMTRSGSVRVDGSQDAEVSCTSGHAQVTGVTARVRTVSAGIDLAAAGDASVETVSGSISISLPAHLHPRILTKGMKRARVEVEEGDDCEIFVRSVSGSIVVRSR